MSVNRLQDKDPHKPADKMDYKLACRDLGNLDKQVDMKRNLPRKLIIKSILTIILKNAR